MTISRGSTSLFNVVAVLKSGGEYFPRHVEWLRRAVRRHLSLPHKFICLSDLQVDCERIPLQHRWPGWWSKLELFRPGLFDGPVVYFDLDTMIVGQLDDVVVGHKFSMLKSFWSHGVVNSSVMSWSVDMSAIYHKFAEDPGQFMRQYRVIGKWGDQDFIARYTPVKYDYLQLLCPARFESYKLTLKGRNPPPQSSVIVFHGQPRPWDTPLWKPYIDDLMPATAE